MIAQPLILKAPSGSVQLESNLLLAPIAGWCELAWRITCRELGGVGLACTDLLSPKGLLLSAETTRDLAQTNDLDKPIGMQLYGSDPDILAEGAAWCAEHGATVVDINMGCPVDKVTKKIEQQIRKRHSKAKAKRKTAARTKKKTQEARL